MVGHLGKAAFLKVQNIPYETNKSGLHICDYDSWYFDSSKKCYICDWSYPIHAGKIYRIKNDKFKEWDSLIQTCNFCGLRRWFDSKYGLINWPLDPPLIGGDV